MQIVDSSSDLLRRQDAAAKPPVVCTATTPDGHEHGVVPGAAVSREEELRCRGRVVSVVGHDSVARPLPLATGSI